MIGEKEERKTRRSIGHGWSTKGTQVHTVANLESRRSAGVMKDDC